MKFMLALYLCFLCLVPCWAEEISWSFCEEEKVQASGPEWIAMKNGHLFHEKTGWFWNPASQEFYRYDPQPAQPSQMNFAPRPFGGFGNDCPQGT